MTTSVPNTPSELLELNNQEQLSPEDQVCQYLFNQSPKVGFKVLTRLVSGLTKLHSDRVEHYLETGETENCHLWTRDLNTLQVVEGLLSTVDM